MTTTLRIETSDSGAYANASEADLYRLIMRLDSKHAYVVVRREAGDLFAKQCLAFRKAATPSNTH